MNQGPAAAAPVFTPGWNMVQAGTATATPQQGQLVPIPNNFPGGLSEAATVLHQTSVFEDRRQKQVRLNGTTPNPSGAVTPQAGAGAAQGSDDTPPRLLQALRLDDDTATQLTLGGLGANINDPTSLEAVAQAPVQNVGDVLKVMQSFHKFVIQPEMYQLTQQVEQAFTVLDDKVNYVMCNLLWLQADNRKEQRQRSSLMVLLQGFPKEMDPPHRLYTILWMLQQVNEFANYITRMGIPYSVNDESVLNVLATLPVTIKMGKYWSTMTLLTFKGFDLRLEFTNTYVGKGNTPLYAKADTPVAGKHIQVLFATPQFQRKLEAPIRVLMRALNKLDKYANCSMVPLWKSLTLMFPTEGKELDHTATACCTIVYQQEKGKLVCKIHILNSLCLELSADSEDMNPHKRDEVTGDQVPYSIWESAWDEQIFGPTLQEDALEDAQKSAFMQTDHTATPGKGKGKGRGKGKHWSRAVVHMDSDNPFPVPVEFVYHDDDQPIAFNWNEYVAKFRGKEGEKVDEAKVSPITVKGKPGI